MWFVCVWLAGYSLLYAYLANLALLILGLVLDEFTMKTFLSQKTISEIRRFETREKERNRTLIKSLMSSYVSFKATLYLFYMVILVLSQIIRFIPDLAGLDLKNFLEATQYSILILVAYDMFSSQFFRDRRKMRKMSKEFVRKIDQDEE